MAAVLAGDFEPSPKELKYEEAKQQEITVAKLAEIFLKILECERQKPKADYDKRYDLVFQAMVLAKEAKCKTGISIDSTEPNWPVFWMELPVYGEFTWHMPTDTARQERFLKSPYTNEDKEARMTKFINECLPITGQAYDIM